MSNYIIGWINNLLTSTPVASTAVSGLGPDQLLNDQGGSESAWQTVGVGTQTLTSSVASGSKWRLFGLFRTNLTTSATGTVTVKNGGSGGTTVYTGSLSAVALGYRQMVAIAPAEVTGDWCQFSISDATNPDLFYNVPLAFGGAGFQPAFGNLDLSSVPRRAAQLTQKVTRAGGVYPRADWNARTFDVSLSSIRQADMPNILAIESTVIQGGNSMFVPNPLSSTLNQDAIFGTVEPQSGIGYRAFNIRTWRILVTERL
jgi:hypothetical protein